MKTNKNLIMKTLIAACGLAILQGLLAGCSGSAPATTEEKTRSSGHLKILEESVWTDETDRFGDSGLIKSKVLTQAGHASAASIMKETTLESLNLPSSLNVNAFTVRSKGNVRTKQAIYFAPKLYFYRKADRAHVKVKQVGDNVLIPLHAILVDGLSQSIPSTDGISTVSLPASYLVDIASVKTLLAERNYDPNVSFGPLDGCAKSFKIAVAGVTYDVTPETLSSGNQCELNRPFTLNLVVPKSQADYIINEALYHHQLDASVTFEVLVGYVESDVKIQLDRSKVYEKLTASLSAKYPPYAKADVKATIQKIIQAETFNLFIKGDRTDVINQLIQLAYDSFVTPYELKPGQESPAECPADTAVCVNISYEKNSETRNLEVGYQQYSTTLAGQNVISLAKPQQILFPEVVFQSSSDQKGTFIDNRSEHQNERSLLITANQGSMIEIEMLGTQSQLDDSEQSASVSGVGSNSCEARDFFKACKWHRYYMHVTRTYTGIKMSEVKSAAGNLLGNPGSELYLKFEKSNGESVKCNFNQLNATGLADRYIIKIENSAECQIFADQDNKNEQVSISFINELRDSKPLIAINGGHPYSHTDGYTQDHSMPAHDGSHLGGHQPKSFTHLIRSIQLEIKVSVRKYDITQN